VKVEQHVVSRVIQVIGIRSLEHGKDINWDQFDASKLSEEQAQTIKMNAITEWSALPATEMFLRDNKHDSDFSAFMSIWFLKSKSTHWC